MDCKKFLLCMIIVFLLITIYNNNSAPCHQENLYASNWTGALGAQSIHRAQPTLIKVPAKENAVAHQDPRLMPRARR